MVHCCAMNDPSSSSERLRAPPSERFEPSVQLLDLEREFARLPEESSPGQGHMQKTLYRRGNCTTAIFEFEKGASIREHIVEGEAIIHLLSGHITVHAPDDEFQLNAGSMLCLASGVAHDVMATARSRMVLHVILGA